jgi:hypothetical protein
MPACHSCWLSDGIGLWLIITSQAWSEPYGIEQDQRRFQVSVLLTLKLVYADASAHASGKITITITITINFTFSRQRQLARC